MISNFKKVILKTRSEFRDKIYNLDTIPNQAKIFLIAQTTWICKISSLSKKISKTKKYNEFSVEKMNLETEKSIWRQKNNLEISL